MLKCLCMVICERRSQDRVFNQVAKASGTTPEMGYVRIIGVNSK